MPEEQQAIAKQPAAKKAGGRPATEAEDVREGQTPAAKTSAPKSPAAKAPRTKTPAAKAPAEKAPAQKAPARRSTATQAAAKKGRLPTEPTVSGSQAEEEAIATGAPAPGTLALGIPAAEQPAAAVAAADLPTADNPLHKKLGLRAETVGVVIAPPPDDDDPLLPLPKGVTLLAALDDVSSLAGPYDYIHVFARDRGDLAGAFATLRDKLAPGGSLWVSWMKHPSDRRGPETFTDLNETIVRRIALTHGMIDVRVLTLDRDWSAVRLVRRRH